MYVCVCVCVGCMSECVRTLVNVYGAYACVNVLVSVCVYVYVCLCKHVCTCICMCSCVRACVVNVHICVSASA